jgi:hypothetical protein
MSARLLQFTILSGFLLRYELAAAYFHLYGIARDDVGYIMGTFPIVKREDEKQHSEYRTKRVILEIYDEMLNLPSRPSSIHITLTNHLTLDYR